ncbi:hypothetical protein [Rhizobium mongolense]|uniref:Uncharacterized protein n=1 Tax=Rhizobium mongolense TaxID=57676 RepID=A0A7W6RUK8_9HYPH|nr:hypothetical protein [Rhizobium mongolense]MBB4278937.1 hypothetical protein [Rhizobium mongolense]
MAHAGIHGGFVAVAIAVAGLSNPGLLHWAVVFGVAETASVSMRRNAARSSDGT